MRTLVGRSGELAQIDRALDDARSGHGRLVLISGAAGIGKSRLAEAAAAAAEARGMAVARGYAIDDAGAPPLWPWLRALRGRAGVDELPPVDADDSDAAARFGLFLAITDLLHDCAGTAGLLLVLEDLHWADRSSLLLLRQIAAELGSSRLAVLVTYRDESEAMRGVLADLVRGESAVTIPLGGLTAGELAAWLPALTDQSDTNAADTLHRATGGNPLLVSLVAAELTSSATTVDVLMAHRPQLRRLVMARVGGLDAPARDVVAAASVLGERIDSSVLTAMVDKHTVAAELEQAQAAGVLRDADGLAFEHALVRDAVYAELGAEKRAELHSLAATALETSATAAPGSIATHWHRAGELARCLPWAQLAAEAARAALAHDDAVRYAELAVACARATEAADDELARLLIQLADAVHLNGYAEPAARLCVEAAALAESAARPDLLAAAGLVIHGSGDRAVLKQIVPICTRALELLAQDDHALRSRLLAQRAVAVAETEGGPRAAELAADALAEAELSGDSAAILEAIAARHLAITVPDTVTERLELGRRAVELGRSTRRPMAAMWGHLWRLNAAIQLGTMREVELELAEIDRVATERRSVLARWHYLRYRATLGALTGGFVAAREADDAATALAWRVGDITLVGLSFAFRMQLALLRGDPGELPDRADEVIAAAPPMPLVRISIPLMHALQGQTELARAEFEEFREVPARFPVGVRWAPTLSQIGLTATMLGDAEVADTVHDLLAPMAPYYAADGSGGVFSQGATALLLGDLARVAGRLDESLVHYANAVAMDVRIGARPFTALSRFGWARSLLAAGRELATALALCEQAAGEFRRLDMPGPLATATEVMQAIESARRSASPLSAREAQVADLVAEALTNREIADRLVLSERTVETHVRSILGKLGFTTRTEIATWVVHARKLGHDR